MSTTTTNSASAMLPSTQRPIPLERREDLRVRVIDYLGVGYYVVKDPVGLQYHRRLCSPHTMIRFSQR